MAVVPTMRLMTQSTRRCRCDPSFVVGAMVGAENVNDQSVQSWAKRVLRGMIFNGCGPTEVSVTCTAYTDAQIARSIGVFLESSIKSHALLMRDGMARILMFAFDRAPTISFDMRIRKPGFATRGSYFHPRTSLHGVG